MNIHWSGLASVLWIGMIAGVGLVALFAIGIRLLAAEPRAGRSGASRPAIAVAGACFAVCAAMAAFGIYLLLGH